jgi:DNA-binding MarR family transcriptional regulator
MVRPFRKAHAGRWRQNFWEPEIVQTDANPQLFEFFNEIGIISQLASAFFSKHLPDGVHVAHFSILNHLVRLGDKRTPVQIAQAFQITKATMTHSLGVLEKHGFIALEPNPGDGRSKLVILTPSGRAFREKAIAAVGPAFAPILAQLDAGDLFSMLPGLRKVRQILDANR